MDINATLIGQAIWFAVFIWITMKFVWPPLKRALDERQRHIADGLAAAERGRQELAASESKAGEFVNQAKQQATEIIAQSEKRAAEIIEEAKASAKAEGDRLLAGAKAEIQQELSRARESLRDQVAALAVAGAEKILRREVDARAHGELIDRLKREL